MPEKVKEKAKEKIRKGAQSVADAAKESQEGTGSGSPRGKAAVPQRSTKRTPNKKGWWDRLEWYEKAGILTAIGVLVLLLGSQVYKWATKDKPEKINIPTNPDPIPQGWSAAPVADKLYSAMFSGYTGWGTYEDTILNALSPLNDTQLVRVYNKYADEYERDLVEDFSKELSGSALNTVMGYYQGLV